MGSELYCLTCGHAEDSHFFDELDASKKGRSNNYCKVEDCDCEQFRI